MLCPDSISSFHLSGKVIKTTHSTFNTSKLTGSSLRARVMPYLFSGPPRASRQYLKETVLNYCLKSELKNVQ